MTVEANSSALQREIKQRKPFQSKGQEALLGLLKTADLTRRLIAKTLEPYGVTPQQYNVLRILRGAGKEGLPTLEVAERMVEQTPGVTRLFDRLEAKGWAERKRCSPDRRQVLCFLTPAGEKLLAELDEPMDAVDSQALAALDARQLDTLIGLLDSIRAAHADATPDKEDK